MLAVLCAVVVLGPVQPYSPNLCIPPYTPGGRCDQWCSGWVHLVVLSEEAEQKVHAVDGHGEAGSGILVAIRTVRVSCIVKNSTPGIKTYSKC